MSGTDSPSDTRPEDSLTDDELDHRILAEHQSIPQTVREQALERDASRCRIDGRHGTGDEGAPQLVVQRLQEHPRDCQPNALENVTTCCLRCARWIKQMPSRDDLPPVLQERLDGADLKTTRVQILKYLYENGPAATSELADAVDLAGATSVRRAVYDLMSRDVGNDDIDRLVVKNRTTGTYGLPWQIDDSRRARGRIPLKPHRRRSRILDAVVYRLLETLDGYVENPRELVADVVDRDLNQTYHMERRAEAFQFPFTVWAETKRPRHDGVAVIEAISILAGATENLSRRRIATALVELFERDDEHELAAVLRRSLLEDGDSPFDTLTSSSAAEANTNESPDETPVERPELQVFDTDDSDVPTLQGNGESTQEPPHSEDQNR
jgi:hypothetical protein